MWLVASKPWLDFLLYFLSSGIVNGRTCIYNTNFPYVKFVSKCQQQGSLNTKLGIKKSDIVLNIKAILSHQRKLPVWLSSQTDRNIWQILPDVASLKRDRSDRNQEIPPSGVIHQSLFFAQDSVLISQPDWLCNYAGSISDSPLVEKMGRDVQVPWAQWNLGPTQNQVT